MDIDRCPKCAAAVRKDADWCTLCYADLRPAPAPPPPVAPVAAAAAAAPVPAPAASDHLDAPFERVLASVYAGDALTQQLAFDTVDQSAPAPSSAPALTGGWPCTECGEINSFELANCHVCTSPFGAHLRGNTPDVDRKSMMIWALSAVAIFLALVAMLTYVTTKRPAGAGDTKVTVGDVAPADQFDQAPVPQAPVQQLPAQQLPGQTVPGQTLPGQTVPGQTLPGQTVPGQALPGQTVPGQTVPGQTVPGQTVPGQTVPQVPPAS